MTSPEGADKSQAMFSFPGTRGTWDGHHVLRLADWIADVVRAVPMHSLARRSSPHHPLASGLQTPDGPRSG